MKFKHKFKRLLNVSNKQSNLTSGIVPSEACDKPYKPGIKIVNPYKVEGYSLNQHINLPDIILQNRSLNKYNSLGSFSEGKRNKSVENYSHRNSRMNQSYDLGNPLTGISEIYSRNAHRR